MKDRIILPIIVFSQFCCTSLWFAGNGVMNELVVDFGLKAGAAGHLTSAVQFGFISGTLIFAILNIPDRFSPSKVFFICALIGAIFNLGLMWDGSSFESIVSFRFMTGFFLAGIYPVGMKIAADYSEKGLGKSLGFLVGALVLGTAFPHLAKDMTADFPWKTVLVMTSCLSFFGGLLMITMVPDGPYRKAGEKLNLSGFIVVFQKRQFRSAAFGYFGHMWELYAFWVFVPVILKTYTIAHPGTLINIPLIAFLIIGIGGLACALGGFVAQKIGTKRTASISLALSGGCCLISPVMFTSGSEILFIGFLLFWGMVVVADSPLFSTLVAKNALGEFKGTALTIVNCIGFSITIISIQLLSFLQVAMNPTLIYTILALGPLLGLAGIYQGKNRMEAIKT